MAEVVRKSTLAILTESTEATPVAPSAATDFLPLQEGFSVAPEFTVLSNAEIKSSIAKAKDTLGVEEPKIEISTYLRHSGVEGQAPMANLIYKAAFGSEVVESGEVTTTTGSSTSNIKLASGGSGLDIGQCLLIKDGSNGFSLRNIEAIATNDITPNFNLAYAPATSITCGKPVSYLPTDDSHPSLSFWFYKGNGSVIELVAGAKVASMSMDFTPGEYINLSASLEGSYYGFNPIVISASNKYIDFKDDAGSEIAATLTVGTYKTMHELATHISTVMTAASVGAGNDTITCTYSNTTGMFTIASNGGTKFELLASSGTNNANGTLPSLGFTKTDKTGAYTYTSEAAVSLAAPYTPSYDTANPLVAKDMEVLFGSSTDTTCFHPTNVSVSLNNTLSPIGDLCASSGTGSRPITMREVTAEVSALLTKYDIDKFNKFQNGDRVKLMLNAGTKSGGNWVAGKCVNFYMRYATITSISIDDQDGFWALNMTLSSYGESTDDEVFMNFL